MLPGEAVSGADPAASASAETIAAQARELLSGFEPLGTTDVFGQVQRAAGIEQVGLLGFATIPRDALIAALDGDFAGIGTPEQTRLLPEATGYVLEDSRYGFRIATGISPAQVPAAQVYANACRQVQSYAARLLHDIRTADKVFVHTASADETPERLLHLSRALARHGRAMLLVVQPSADPAQAGQVTWLGPTVMLGRLLPQTTLECWVALCRSAAELVHNVTPSDASYRFNVQERSFIGRKEQPVLFVQTADPIAYRSMLNLTAPVNISYCMSRGYLYESYLGIKKGVAPFHATYNRIFILQELIERNNLGWICYMDADAFVADFSFNIDQYLFENQQYCFIACTGGSDTPWDINAGVFFLNLADADGRALARDWFAKFEMLVPRTYLTSHQARWGGGAPDDQQILYEVLKSNPALLRRTKKENDGSLFNYRDGRFIKQATRESFADSHDRMNWIRNETRKVLEKFQVQGFADGYGG